MLFTVLISLVALILGILLGLTFGFESDSPIQIFVGRAVILPALSVTVRRLHDLDRTGWWCLIPFIPIIGSIVILVFACMRGTDGTNRFGPDPLGTGNDRPELRTIDMGGGAASRAKGISLRGICADRFA